MTSWKLIDFNNPDELPAHNQEIWLCRWTPSGEGCTVTLIVWSCIQRATIEQRLKAEPVDVLYLWQYYSTPEIPHTVDIVTPYKCLCKTSSNAPCYLAFEDDGYCVGAFDESVEPIVSTCPYRKQVKEIYCS